MAARHGFQANMVEELAHLQWRINRAGRMQETLTAEHVKKVEADRHQKTMTWRYHYVDMVDFLSLVQQDAARPDFFAPPGYIRRLTVAFADEMKGGIVEILSCCTGCKSRPTSRQPQGGCPPTPRTTGTGKRSWRRSRKKRKTLSCRGQTSRWRRGWGAICCGKNYANSPRKS